MSKDFSGAAPAPAPLQDAPATTPAPDRLLQEVIMETPPHAPPRPARVDGVAIGRLSAIDADGTLLVSVPALGLERVAARSTCLLDASHIGRELALAFENGDPTRPIALGAMMPAAPAPAPAPQFEARVDGERVVLEAEEEIELRCGEAAIVLTADGRIQIRGTYITSHASATQRILGGSVNVN